MSKEDSQKERVVIPRKVIYGLIISYLSALVMTIVSIQYANYVDNNSNNQWCDLMVVLDDAYKQTPPQSPTGQIVAKEIHRLRIKFEC